MKRCPECRRDYYDETLRFCLDDGAALLEGPASVDEPTTFILQEYGAIRVESSFSEAATRPQIHTTEPQDASLQRQSHYPHSTNDPRRRFSGRTFLLAGAGAALLLVGGFFGYQYFKGDGGQIGSIAVLPFENTSGNAELDYLSEGLSESLIERLSQLPQLKVISRNSSFKFRGANVDPLDAASQLGVRAIVTGSIAQLGDELSIKFEIVDAAENRHLSGGQYRRKAGELISIQNEIAQKAADQLRVKLTNSQSRRIAASGTENSDAYRYYLSGLVELNGPQGAQGKALEHFEEAVKLDPDFAAGHAEIAWIYWVRANGSENPHELMPRSKTAVEKALAIDPDLAKARTVRAMIYEYEFDWASAEKEYKSAIELSPNLDFARNNYAFFLSVLDRQSEALGQLEEQRSRDPLNQRLFLLQKGIVLVQARKFDEALQTYREAQAIDLSKPVPDFALGYAYAGKGLNNEAVAYYKKAVTELGGEEKYSQPLVYLAATLARMPDKRNEALAILTRIEKMDEYVSPALLAAIYTALGDNDKAMELLEQAYINRDLLLRFIGTGYEYDGLRTDPRFINLTKRIGFAQTQYETMPGM